MKSLKLSAIALAALLASGSLMAAKYTYHGQMIDGTEAANGKYDIQIQSFSAPNGAKSLAPPTELLGVDVVLGGFAIDIDAPENLFGETYVQLAIRPTGSDLPYEPLGAPKPIAKVADLGCDLNWSLEGNAADLTANSFVGIADPASNLPLVLKAKNQVVARFVADTVASDHPTVILGSSTNTATGRSATISGGLRNSASGLESTTGGGYENSASGYASTVAGGWKNTAAGQSSLVAGGNDNHAHSLRSSVLGGAENKAFAQYATVAGGDRNCAGGEYSMAMGSSAKVRHGNDASDLACPGGSSSGDADGDQGTFVWADRQEDSSGNPIPFVSSGANQFLVRAQGGMVLNGNKPYNSFSELTIYPHMSGGNYPGIALVDNDGDVTEIRMDSDSNALKLDTENNGANSIEVNNGARLTAGGVWTNASSRTLKTAFETVDVSEILGKVINMPITTWKYKKSIEGRHIGPVAEDFKEIFGLSGDGKAISTVDADGVALAAIQGLNQKLETENANLKAENADIKVQLASVLARLDKLEADKE